MIPFPVPAACLSRAYARAAAAHAPRRPLVGVPGAWELASRSQPGVWWAVRPVPGGWACTCPARGLCWHIAAVVGPAPACPTCGAAVQVDGAGWACAGCGTAGTLSETARGELLATYFTGQPPPDWDRLLAGCQTPQNGACAA